MDTVVPPATIKQVAQFMTALEQRGVGSEHVQQTIENGMLLTRIAGLIRGENEQALIDLSVPFEEGALRKTVYHIFSVEINRLQDLADREGYEFVRGRDPMSLASEIQFRQLLEGLSPIHLAVVVWRAGLHGTPWLKGEEVAERLGVDTKTVARIRGEAITHMKARQRELYPLSYWKRLDKPKPSVELKSDSLPLGVDAHTPIETLTFTVKTYNCLKREGFHQLGQLVATNADALYDIRNLGRRGVEEVQQKLASYGLELASA